MKKEHKIYTYKGSDIDWSVSKGEPLILTLTNYIGNEDDVFVPSEVDSPNINANNYEYDYTGIYGEHYLTKTGTYLDIQENHIEYVTLERIIPMFTFTVNCLNPTDAEIILETNGYTQNNNTITVKYGTNVNYTVQKDGWYTISGNYLITKNTVLNVSLTKKESFDFTIKPKYEDNKYFVQLGLTYGHYKCFENEIIVIDWGDENKTTIDTGNINELNCYHQYENDNEYTVKIYSTNNKMPYINMKHPSGDTIKVLTPFLKMVDTYGNSITQYGGFSKCSELILLPNMLFSNNRQINEFKYTPTRYDAADRIEEGPYYKLNCYLGHNNRLTISGLALQNYHSCFEYCSKLKEIPDDLFDYTTNITHLDGCFRGCGIETIPEKLFNNTTNILSFTGTFAECSQLREIPEKLFYNNKNAEYFNGTFAYCTSLIRLPKGLFRSNLKIPGIQNPTFENYGYGKQFNMTFKGCTNLKYGIDGGSIKDSITEITLTNYKGDEDDVFVPSEVDSPNINVNDYDYTLNVNSNKFKPEYYIDGDGIFPNTAESFTETFMNCTNLLYVPTNTFNLCINATDFMATFLGCKNLEYVGDNLFENMLKAYLFGNIFKEGWNHGGLDVGSDNHDSPRGTFAECSKLKINPKMFGDLSDRFSNNNVEIYHFGAMFARKEFNGTHPGTAPELWKCNYGNSKVSGEHCFSRNGNKNLTNYNDIPELWKLRWFDEREYADAFWGNDFWGSLEESGRI